MTELSPDDRSTFERLRPRLVERIRLMMGEDARRTAESGDFLQGLWVEALRDRTRWPESDNARLRLFTAIARNNIRDAVRKRREDAFFAFSTTLLPPGSGESPSQGAMQAENAQRLAEGLEVLTAQHREVIELRNIEGHSFREVGERLGRSEDAARKLHARAMVSLGRALRGRLD